MQGHLYFIMGVSGSGKWTLRQNLKNTNANISFVRSYVTREMRPGEINGDMYWFVDLEEFKKSIDKNEFLEYEVNHKVAYYGTKFADIENGLSAWKILVKEIETKWLKQIAEKHPELRNTYTSIFLDIPDEVVRKRFYERNPQGKMIDLENRIESCQKEREAAQNLCDYIIDASVSPELVLHEVLKIMK